jgi:probable HAF family extracellular repeat protein
MKTSSGSSILSITATTLVALTLPLQLAAEGHTTQFRHYKLIDVGTFGGPASFINNPAALGAPNQINASGVAVGSSATSTPLTPESNTAVCGGVDGIVPFIFHAFKWHAGNVTDLGALPGDNNCSIATSVNARGEIVGQSENGIVDPLFGSNEFRAVLWKSGRIEDLGTFGGKYSVVSSINNRGQISGLATNSIPDPFSLLYQLVQSPDGTQTRAFIWENGEKHDLGTLGGPDAQPFGLVSERGEIVGVSYTNSSPNASTNLPTADPFLWSKERGMIDLGTLGGVWGSAGLVNNRGQVVGSSSVAADPAACLGNNDPANCHPFLWENGHLIDLNTESLGGSPINANALNDAGDIVGTATFPERPISDAYLWRNGIATDLGTVGDDCYSEGFAITARAQVVGQSLPCPTSSIHTFLWENGSIIDLNALGSPKVLRLIEVFAINDRGEIGGIGVPPGCSDFTDDACGHAFLLVPVCADGTEGCADAPLDPDVVAQSRASGAMPTRMTAQELEAFKRKLAHIQSRMIGRNRTFGFLTPDRVGRQFVR